MTVLYDDDELQPLNSLTELGINISQTENRAQPLVIL